MKIFLYSDLHISRTSSIMPVNIENSKYTFRQNMIIQLGQFMGKLVEDLQPDLIINCGDTFDQHTVTSYDIDVASQFFKQFPENIKHYVLVGNHEMVNQNFNAIALLNNIPNIEVIDEACTVEDLAFLPYCNYNDILEFPEGKYLFAHQDIQGSLIRGEFALPEGISTDILREKYKLVFNGHIHKSSINQNVINVGSISTHSFSDDNDNIPQCYLFDTETLDLQVFKPNICPLFRKYEMKDSMSDLYTYIDSLDKNYKYILHIVCPFELKEEVRLYLQANEMILNSRIGTRIKKEEKIEEPVEQLNLQANIDITQSFKEFINEVELKYPKELYMEILKGVN